MQTILPEPGTSTLCPSCPRRAIWSGFFAPFLSLHKALPALREHEGPVPGRQGAFQAWQIHNRNPYPDNRETHGACFPCTRGGITGLACTYPCATPIMSQECTHEKNIPAQQGAPRPYPWFPRPHGHQEWSCRSEPPSRQRSQDPERLGLETFVPRVLPPCREHSASHCRRKV